MKSIILFIVSIAFAISGGWARQRSYSEIQDIAQKQLALVSDVSTRSRFADFGTLIPASRILMAEATRAPHLPEAESFYVFSTLESGFVIVSGDDQMKPVLAYSDNGSFYLEELPANIRSWLQFYENEFRFLKDKKIENTSRVTVAANGNFPELVPPLLTDIKWDQGSPYNNYCPEYKKAKTVTGCVATAMAQVMKYYNYPVSGRYSKSYTTGTLKLDCGKDFSTVTFQWDKILPFYEKSYTADNADAVAELMLCCGISVEMDYGLSTSGGSGASSAYIPDALINYFQYNENIQILLRDYYSYTEWVDMLKNEISARRPVIYGGSSSSLGGHEFVIDGYDKTGLFHVNWGWSGANNGYFEISSLNPDVPGIGGGNGGEGFDTGQDAVIGIQKETVGRYVSQFLLSAPIQIDRTSISRTGSFRISIPEIFNYGTLFTGQVQPLLYKAGVLVAEIGRPKLFEKLKRQYGYTADANFGFSNLTIPSNIEAGDYQIYIASKEKRETDWSLAKSKMSDIGYFNVRITNSGITFTNPVVKPELQVLSISSENKSYANKIGNYKVVLKNEGNECSVTLGLAFQSVTNPDKSPTLVANVKTSVLTGEEKELSLSGRLEIAAGDYEVLPYYSMDGSNRYLIAMKNPVKLTVSPEPIDQTTVLSLLEPIEVENVITIGEPLTMALSLKNLGGVYDGTLAAAIFEKGGSSSSVDAIFKAVFIDTDETKTVSISAHPNIGIGEYIVSMQYYTDGFYNTLSPSLYSQFELTVKDVSSGMPERVTGEKAVLIYPQPIEDNLNIRVVKDVYRLEIINSSGAVVRKVRAEFPVGEVYVLPVSELASGLYLLRLYTADKLYVEKFIKK